MADITHLVRRAAIFRNQSPRERGGLSGMRDDKARLKQLNLRQRPRHPILPLVRTRVMEYEYDLFVPQPHYQKTKPYHQVLCESQFVESYRLHETEQEYVSLERMFQQRPPLRQVWLVVRVKHIEILSQILLQKDEVAVRIAVFPVSRRRHVNLLSHNLPLQQFFQ